MPNDALFHQTQRWYSHRPMTESLYYRDPLLREFESRIVAIDDTRTELTLAATAFYPEGGGQPADTGSIADSPIIDVQKSDDGTIVHTLSQPLPASASPGDTVTGSIDWAHRWEYMQQHSGQHVLSGALMRAADAPTVSVHQGADVTSIEVERDSLSDADLMAVVDLANEVIADDRPITDRWIEDTDLGSYALRRPTKRTGRIRLVEIDSFDLVACGGVHLPRTGLLNLVQLVAVERIRGRLRLAYKIGDRALSDYREKHRTVTAVAELFSARPEQTPERVASLISEIKDQNGSLRRRAERIAKSIIGTLPQGPEPQVLVLERENEDIFRAIAEGATTHSARRLVVCNIGLERIDWAIVIGSGHEFPADVIRKMVLSPLDAKGGGKPPLWRGVIPGTDADLAKRFSERFREALSSKTP